MINRRIISLNSFAKTGLFGNIKVGESSKNDVIQLLGDNYEWADCGESQIIKYGWYEFFYWTESQLIFGIQNDHLKFDCTNHDEMICFENEIVKIDHWFLKVNEHITYSNLKEIFNQEGIPYKVNRQPYDGALDYIELSNGIAFDFDDSLVNWSYDRITDEWNMNEVPIETPADFVLVGMRLFNQ